MRSTVNMVRVILFLMLFLSAGNMAAQDYLMIRPGERIPGQVIRNFDYNNYRTLKFQPENGDVKVYQPQEIHGFELENGRLFLSQKIPGREDPVIVQRIFSGKVNLNHYAGRYFLDNGVEMLELKVEFVKKEVDRRDVVVKQKPYVGILQYHLIGQCGITLSPYINGVDITEDSLVGVLKRYHECEGLDYDIHVEKLPLLKLSPVLMVGQGMINITPNSRSTGRRDALETTVMPHVQLMLRLHSFRKAPKPFLEIGFGFRKESNIAYAELVEGSVRLTGREEFSTTAWYVPVSINHLLYHTKVMDLYIGGGVTLWKTNFKSHSSMIDLNQAFNTFLHEEAFYGRNLQQTVPSLKLGANVFTGTKLRIVGELKSEYFTDHHRMNLLYNRASYNQLMTSFSLGLQY